MGRFQFAPLLSASSWEVPSFLTSFWSLPFVFINLLGGSLFVFFSATYWERFQPLESWCFEGLYNRKGGTGITTAGVAILRRAFILILAYTNRLTLSRRQTGILDTAIEIAAVVTESPRRPSLSRHFPP